VHRLVGLRMNVWSYGGGGGGGVEAI